MSLGLTRKQRELLNFINSYSQEHGCSPSYQEMADGVNLRSKSGVFRLVKALHERGHIIKPTEQRARSIVSRENATFLLHLPFELEWRLRMVAEQCSLTPEQMIVNTLRERVAPKAA